MTETILLLLCVVIGAVSGLRSLTGIGVVTIAAQRAWPHLGWLHLGGTGLSFLGTPAAMYVFVMLAIGELIADKSSFIPPRIQAGPLAARSAASLARELNGKQSATCVNKVPPALPQRAHDGRSPPNCVSRGFALFRWSPLLWRFSKGLVSLPCSRLRRNTLQFACSVGRR